MDINQKVEILTSERLENLMEKGRNASHQNAFESLIS